MANKYQLLEDLERLRKSGTITEEEFQREREKIMNDNFNRSSESEANLLGMDENTYLMVMHLSQFFGYITAGLGFIAPIILWLINKDKNDAVDQHGKNILNFLISWIIYGLAGFVLTFTIILSIVGIPLLIVLAVLQVVFIILAAVKANNGEFWKYPMTISFFSCQPPQWKE